MTYPLDLAQGRMASDMSKKPSLYQQVNRTHTMNMDAFRSKQMITRPDRLYSSVLDCITKSRQMNGSLLVGYPAAIAMQIPHSVILFTSFEFFNSQLIDDSQKFNKYDDYTFVYKFLQRFGAATFSITLANAICYPLDTLKRRY